MLIREATPADWPKIWPFWQKIVSAGETYAWDRETPEEQARRLWMSPAARIFVVEEAEAAAAAEAAEAEAAEGTQAAAAAEGTQAAERAEEADAQGAKAAQAAQAANEAQENGNTRIVASAYVKANYGGPASAVANAGFMVDPAQAGRGIGRRLAEHVLREAANDGYRAMVFNAVVATNPAVKLWLSLGFSILGTVPDAFDHPVHGPVGLHIMHRKLT
ncbi:GNAT family N-acetyltransferase [Actinoplanes sp. NBC_00393]|uniref:GNAT family N-acetyltransferase n=1 Tax=Actinoplanes sp. NBC_00393 TaxID=2975953 RepID=UPI002E1B0754